MKERAIRSLERCIKGVSNTRRIKILLLLERQPGLSLNGIAESDRSNIKTISEHMRRLTEAGLVSKKNNGRIVNHFLTGEGQKMISIFKEYF